jgi:hypothetical protein
LFVNFAWFISENGKNVTKFTRIKLDRVNGGGLTIRTGIYVSCIPFDPTWATTILNVSTTSTFRPVGMIVVGSAGLFWPIFTLGADLFNIPILI